MSRQSGHTFTDRTLVISGASRGIGLAIALGAARRGANVVLLAKTAELLSARADAGTADEHEPALVGRAPVLHALEIRHDVAVAGLGRRICRRGHRIRLPLARDLHRHRGGGQFAGFDSMLARSRDPQIMGDAAVEIFSGPLAAEVNGKCYIDSALLVEAGVTDLTRYGGGDDPILDIFVDKS